MIFMLLSLVMGLADHLVLGNSVVTSVEFGSFPELFVDTVIKPPTIFQRQIRENCVRSFFLKPMIQHSHPLSRCDWPTVQR